MAQAAREAQARREADREAWRAEAAERKAAKALAAERAGERRATREALRAKYDTDQNTLDVAKYRGARAALRKAVRAGLRNCSKAKRAELANEWSLTSESIKALGLRPLRQICRQLDLDPGPIEFEGIGEGLKRTKAQPAAPPVESASAALKCLERLAVEMLM